MGTTKPIIFFEGWRNRNLGRKVLGVVRAGKGTVVQFCRSKNNASKDLWMKVN